MSEEVQKGWRSYFSYRWAIPGYTFILIAIAINHVPIREFLENVSLHIANGVEIFGVFLGFLTLLTGSALGFLTSQLWYLRFNKNGGVCGVREWIGIDEILRGYNFQGGRNDASAVFDFLVYFDKDKKFLEYVWRRWDIYHLLGSVRYTMGLGLGMAVVFRLYEAIIMWSFPTSEIVLFLLTVFAIILAMFVFQKCCEYHMRLFQPAYRAVINHVLCKYETEVVAAFPDFFHKS